jgi:hypothetical protein
MPSIVPTRAISFAIAGALLLAIFWPVLHPPNTTLHQAVLQRQFKAMKAPADAKVIYVDEKPKRGRVFIGGYYTSGLSFEQLQHYYLPQLQRNGWHKIAESPLLVSGRDFGGRELTLCKGEYRSTVEYAGKNQNAGWTFALTMSWDSKTECAAD